MRGVQRVRHPVDICGDICRDGPVPRLMPKQSRTTHGWYNVRPCSPKKDKEKENIFVPSVRQDCLEETYFVRNRENFRLVVDSFHGLKETYFREGGG